VCVVCEVYVEFCHSRTVGPWTVDRGPWTVDRGQETRRPDLAVVTYSSSGAAAGSSSRNT
jgi:hypothetical protein